MNEKENKGMNYQVMKDMVQNLKEQTDTYRDLVRHQFSNEGLSYEKLRHSLIEYSEDDLKDIDIDILKDIIEKAITDGDLFESGFIGFNEDEKTTAGYDVWLRDKAIESLKSINDVIDSEKELESMQNEADSIVAEYAAYLTSDKYYEDNMKRIEKLKDDLEKEEDPKLKEKIKGMIEALENRYTLQFMFKRLNEMGDAEVKRIVDIFFDDKRSQYVMKRYRDKSTKLGYNPDIYKYFLYLEEKYLEEEYHVYDNLFLFIVINFIAYVDPYNKKDAMYAQAIVNNIANIIYEKFPNEKTKSDFLNVMRNVLNFFSKYHDLFNEKNFLHPKHPRRIEKDKEREKELRDMIYSSLQLTDSNITDEIRNMSIEELKSFYESKLDEIEAEKQKQVEIRKPIPILTDNQIERLRECSTSFIIDINPANNDPDIIKYIEHSNITRNFIYDTMKNDQKLVVGIVQIGYMVMNAVGDDSISEDEYIVTIIEDGETVNVKGIYNFTLPYVAKDSGSGRVSLNELYDIIKKQLPNAEIVVYSYVNDASGVDNDEIKDMRVTTCNDNDHINTIHKICSLLDSDVVLSIPSCIVTDITRAVFVNGKLTPKRGFSINFLMSYLTAISSVLITNDSDTSIV